MSKIINAVINNKVYEYCIENGYSDNQSKIIASKIDDVDSVDKLINAKLSDLPDLNNLDDIDKASDMIHSSIINNERIAVVCDYDSDGINSAIVLVRSLIRLFGVDKKMISIIINKRINGNGITDALLETIIMEHNSNKIDLVITADHGSNNKESIEILKKFGMKVIVTDHHLISDEHGSYNADAFVNPQKTKDTNPYRFVSGCAVAYFLMVNTAYKYKDVFKDQDDHLLELLPMVAISTIGDSMSIIDPINRALVTTGINELNTLRDPLWQAVKYLLDITIDMDEETIGYNIVPAINASSRMGDPMVAFNFYMAEDYRDAVIAYEALLKVNDGRKKLQKHLVKNALFQCFNIEDKYSITIKLEKGLGINGIVSSMVGEQFFKPIVTFVKKDGAYHGSGRSINSKFDLHSAFKNIEDADKDIFIKWGGHKQASGCTVRIDKINDFKRLFELEAIKQLKGTDSDKMFEVIGELEHNLINETIIDDIKTIKPFGIRFNKVYYSGIFTLYKINFIGREKEHLILKLLLDDGSIVSSFIFNSDNKIDSDLLQRGNKIKAVYRPVLNLFRGSVEFRLDIIHMEQVSNN